MYSYIKDIGVHNMDFLFKQNLILKAKSAYKGNWFIGSQIFDLFDLIVDIKDPQIREQFNLPLNTIDTNQLDSTWRIIVNEHKKHIRLNEDLIDNITSLIKLIKIPFHQRSTEIDKLIPLYKLGKYKELISSLLAYVKDFFTQIGLKVKPIKLKSPYTELTVYGFTPDLSESESFISEQVNKNSAIKDKLFQNFQNELKKKGYFLSFDYDYITINSPTGTIGYVTEDKFDKIYTSLDELKRDINKKKIIDDNYDKLILGNNGQLLTEIKGQVLEPQSSLRGKGLNIQTPQSSLRGQLLNKTVPQSNLRGKGLNIQTPQTPSLSVATTLDYLPPLALKTKLDDYNFKIQEYNSKLKPYEPKLSNDPKTIQLGEYTLKVVKVFYKNITRPIIIEGPYTGIFLDQMVSSTGKILGSNATASPYFTQNRRILESLGDTSEISEIKVKDYVNKKPIPSSTLVEIESLKASQEIKDSIPKLTGISIITDYMKPDTSMRVSHHGSYNRIVSNIFNPEGLSIVRRLYLKDGEPESIYNDLFVSNPCMPDGLGTKIFTQQVKSASELGFKFIETEAVGDLGSSYAGYYVWPKLGYNIDFYIGNIFKSIQRSVEEKNAKKYSRMYYNMVQIKDWFKKTLNQDLDKDGTISILDLYACKVNGKFIGQELWKNLGSDIQVTFDLTPGSLSMRILDRYIELKAKSQGVSVQEFLNKGTPTSSNNLECFMGDVKVRNQSEVIYALKIAIKNHENGVIVKLLDPKHQYHTNFMDFIKNIKDTNITNAIRTIAKIYKSPMNNKFASSSTPQEDPILKELDMGVLDQVWDEINTMYESGNF